MAYPLFDSVNTGIGLIAAIYGLIRSPRVSLFWRYIIGFLVLLRIEDIVACILNIVIHRNLEWGLGTYFFDLILMAICLEIFQMHMKKLTFKFFGMKILIFLIGATLLYISPLDIYAKMLLMGMAVFSINLVVFLTYLAWDAARDFLYAPIFWCFASWLFFTGSVVSQFTFLHEVVVLHHMQLLPLYNWTVETPELMSVICIVYGIYLASRTKPCLK